MVVAHNDARTTRDHAFTMVEVVVVLLLVAVMIAMAIRLLGSSRASSDRASAVAAARTIGDAIDDFRKDHGGRPPVLGDARDWPAPTGRGPSNPTSGTRYLRKGPPEAIGNGIAQVVTGTTSSRRFALQYERSAARPGSWRITVRDRDGVVSPCTVSGGAEGALPATAVKPC